MTIAAVNSVVDDLILAVILVSLVMFLFLRSYRNSLIVLIAIPTSLITAFAVMWLMGFTLNLMTLLAMSLIIGILVDDAIVILENIQRHLDMGKDKELAALEGRMEIGFFGHFNYAGRRGCILTHSVFAGICGRYAQTIFNRCNNIYTYQFIGGFYPWFPG